MIDYMDPGPKINYMPYSQEVQRREWEDPRKIVRSQPHGEFMRPRGYVLPGSVGSLISFEALDAYLRKWAQLHAQNLWQAGWGGQEMENRQWTPPADWSPY